MPQAAPTATNTAIPATEPTAIAMIVIESSPI